MANYIGQQIGNYRIQQLLGRGGFAEVYLANHIHLKKQAAIKLLHTSADSENLKQFCQEAQIVTDLKHPHIINVLEFGIENQTPFLVMEYAPQGSLRGQHPKGTRLSLDQVVAYTKQIASALQYAHKQHVIHQDVKPENILLNGENGIVLSDFGLAIIIQSMVSLSIQNPAGTPYYMAPEQLRGKPCAASDQYALGIMVYEWISGNVPFQGPIMALLHQHINITPPSLCEQVSTLPASVESVILKALSKAPGDRFPDTLEFASALEQAALLVDIPSASHDTSPLTGEVTQLMSETFPLQQSAHTEAVVKFLPGTDEIDNKVMKLLCDAAIVSGSYWVNTEELIDQAETMNIPSAEFFDSLRILQRKGYIELKEAMGGHIGLIKLLTRSFERYALTYIVNYQELKDAVVTQLANEEMRTNTAIAIQLQQPALVIDHILHQLAGKSLIDLVETLGREDNIRVYNISPELRRIWKKDKEA